MDVVRIVGYVVYAIGIIGGAEGVIKESIGISVVALAFVVVGAVLLGWRCRAP